MISYNHLETIRKSISKDYGIKVEMTEKQLLNWYRFLLEDHVNQIHTRIPFETTMKILDMNAYGFSDAEIGRKFHISTSAIHRHLIEVKYHQLTRRAVDTAIRLGDIEKPTWSGGEKLCR